MNPPFPIIADAAELLYACYGLERSLVAALNPANLRPFTAALRAGFRSGPADGTRTRIPADFLIDANGIIQHVFYGKVIADHIPFEDVEAWLTG